jgi:ADP-dependent phosphofructokinase/glucokinase
VQPDPRSQLLVFPVLVLQLMLLSLHVSVLTTYNANLKAVASTQFDTVIQLIKKFEHI